MRLFLIGIIITLSITLLSTNSILAKENENDIKGVVYGQKIIELESKKQLNAKMKINNLAVRDRSLDVSLKLTYDEKEFELETSGKVYPSGNMYTGGYLVDLDDTEDYIILSFKIEEEAKKALLLPINYNLEGETVVKIALIDKKTEDLIYFEDKLSNQQEVNAIKEVSRELTLDNFNDQHALNEQEEKISHMDSWFMPFLESNKEKNVSEKDLEKELSLAGDNLPPLIPSGFFQTTGDALSTYRDSGGYYITTTTWPAGSDNLLSHAIQWSWPHNAPEDFLNGQRQQFSDISLELTHQGQFLYIAKDGRIDMIDNTAYYRMKNPSISVGIMEKNSEIISQVLRGSTFTGRDVSVDLMGLAGLTGIDKNFIIKMISTINFVEDKQTSDKVTFHDSVANQVAIWDNAVRAYSYRLTDQFFKDVNDKIDFSFRVQIPTDEDIERNPGKRNIEYNFQFDIYGRNMFGFYTDKVEEVEKYFKKSYEVME